MTNWAGFAAALTLAGVSTAGVSVAQTAITQEQVALEADTIQDDQTNNRIIAEGNVQASYEGRILRADRLIYDLTTRKVRAVGNVSILDPDGTQRFADEVEVDENLADGYAVGFSTRFAEGGVAVANSAVRQSDGINALDQAIYTACDVCEETGERPTWSLRARRAVLDENSDIISYRDVVLEVAGIPVFYTPYFFHPDPTAGRRSGFLPPQVRVSDRLGFTWGQPYHRVLSRSADATVTPFYYANARPLVALNLRKKFWSGEVEIDTSYTYERDFDNEGNLDPDTPEEHRANVFARGLFQVNQNWKWGFGAERVTDDTFTRLYSIPGDGDRRGLYDSQPRNLLSQIYTVGQDENSYFDASFIAFQSELAGVRDGTLPVATPFIFSEQLFDFGRFGDASLSASTAVLSRLDGPDSRRVSVGGEWRTAAVAPGGFVLEPFAEARGDFYDLDPDFSGDDEVLRGVGSVGAQLSWPLVRPGSAIDLIIEPTVMGAYGVANANVDAIPIEDSLLYEADETSLFEPNGASNFDLYEGDGRVAVGFTGSARLKSGARLDFVGGRRWRSRTDEAFTPVSNLDGTSSDWVAGLAVDFGAPLRLDGRFRIDEETAAFNRIDAGMSTRWKRLRASGRYFRVDGSITDTGVPVEGFAVNAEVRVTDNILLLYSQLRDVINSTDRSQAFGVAYEDECSRFELLFRRSEIFDGPIQPNNSIEFRFSLKNLGDFGSSEF